MMKYLAPLTKTLLGLALIGLAIAASWLYRDRFSARYESAAALDPNADGEPAPVQTIVEVSVQARKNLGLHAQPLRPQDYWRTVLIPGEIADRPGISDRGVTSPAVGVVTTIHAYPGDTVREGETLFTLRLFSEYLQATQTRLFKAIQETAIIDAEINRLSEAVRSGAVSKNRLIELKSESDRQNTLLQTARQELLTRGLTPDHLQQIEGGTFVSTIEVVAPPAQNLAAHSAAVDAGEVQQASLIVDPQTETPLAYEIQELKVELGQQVQAGQVLANLSNHQSLYVVGHAFKREASLLEQATKEQYAIDIEFSEDRGEDWPPLQQDFQIRHLANSIDTDSRTFDFFIPLSNQSRSYRQQDDLFLVWRFRPGQRVRLHVPVEKFENVFVVPSAAVARDGADAFVYRQNGDLFKQIPVHVLHEDRRFIVIANDGSLTPGTYLAQHSAASLQRMLQAQSASGEQPGLHVHADGTVHAAH